MQTKKIKKTGKACYSNSLYISYCTCCDLCGSAVMDVMCFIKR